TEFLTQTRGYGIINHTFETYMPLISGRVGGRRAGVLVSMEKGKASEYGIMGVEDRGTIFVAPGTEVYEGMIVGEHTREND
ncbi:translational GTPase TypA, partial [Planococcus sp. SIMBA_143]